MLFLLLLAAFAAQESSASNHASLFDEPGLLEVELAGPIEETIDDREEREERPFTLRLGGDEWPVQVRVRGKSRSREEVCEFPPLRLRFENAVGIFAGQSKLKLVTHCRGRERGDANAMEEYVVYRIFNLLTPYGFRVRPARISYADTGSRRNSGPETHYGFFLEPEEQLAERTGTSLVELDGVRLSQLDTAHAALVYVFQYLVGNTDWSLVTGDGSDHCCHNGLLLEADDQLKYVPYDFDLTGLVNAIYAKPDPSLRIRNVRKRRYLGFCTQPEPLFDAIQIVSGQEQEIYEVIRSAPGLSEKDKASDIEYLGQFFEKARDEEKLRKQFEKQCKSP